MHLIPREFSDCLGSRPANRAMRDGEVPAEDDVLASPRFAYLNERQRRNLSLCNKKRSVH